MKQVMQSIRFERQRKFLMVLPVIVMPFLVFVVWVLGLVGPAETMGQSRPALGLNLNLPAAAPAADSTWNKLKFYEQADKDSAKMRKLQKQDPYFNKRKTVDELLKDSESRYRDRTDVALNEADAQEKKVYEKISAIHREIERPARRAKPMIKRRETEVDDGKVDRLERMMAMMNNKEPEEDPEMQQINAMMEKIMDVQHPERVVDRMKKEVPKPKLFDVVLTPEPVSKTSVETNRFFSLDGEQESSSFQQNTIAAVMHEQQSVADNEIVKLRLIQSIFINGVEIPENHFLFALAKVNGHRLQLHIGAVQLNGRYFPVSLNAIGADGLEGVALTRSAGGDAAGGALDKSAQGLTLSSLDPSLGAQVASAVLQSGKSLLKKQTKVVRYTIPAGFNVLFTATQ